MTRRAHGFSFVAFITTLHFSWCSSQILDEAQLPHNFSGHFQELTDSRIPSPTSELYHTFFSTSFDFNVNTIKLTNVKFTVWWDLTNRCSLNNYLIEHFHYPWSSLVRSLPASHPTRWNHCSAFWILPFPQGSYEWNHTLYHLPCLASFIQHDVFKTHPCRCTHW